MDKQDIIKMASDFIKTSEGNYISNERALCDAVRGMRIFEAPIFAIGSADDPYFQNLKEPSAIGEHFMAPKEWMPQAKTVISFFLPYTDAVKRGNSRDMLWPSNEWLHGRIEGHALLIELCKYLNSELIKRGYSSIVPCLDDKFWSENKLVDECSEDNNILNFTSNWSERHIAFVCGLGTFGLSKGLITNKGISGRFGSIITELYITPDKRQYDDIYEYCTMCGACGRNCPASAISVEKGKDHKACFAFLEKTREKHAPRYGCGKCQVKVPCEGSLPRA